MVLQSLSKAKQIGQAAEEAACHYLQQQGLHLIAKNYACKVGEIDLIMLEQQTLVFVEVRYRNNANYGSSGETVTFIKQHKLIKTAQYFLQRHSEYQSCNCRFDVLALHRDLPNPQLEWIKDAFQMAHF
jgi:putative endonuclease